MSKLLRAALSRRPRRAIWLYGVIGALYILFATWFIGDTGQDIPRDLPRLWGLFVPPLVTLMQITYPTILGWALTFSGVSFYALVGLYYSIVNLVERPAQLARDPQAFGFGLAFDTALIAIVVALYRHRPWVARKMQ